MSELQEWLIYAVVVLLCLGLPPIFTAIVAQVEKRSVWPYVDLVAEAASAAGEFDSSNPYAVSGLAETPLPLTGQAAKVLHAAQRLDFVPVAICRHSGGGIYQVRYDFWLSPEREVLAMVGGGKLATVPVNAIWLFSRLHDGHCLVTVNKATASEYDASGVLLESLQPNASLPELVVAHLRRVKRVRSGVALYSATDVLRDHYNVRTHWVNSLEALGHARFRDAERTVWQYTFLGAMVFTVQSTLRSYRRAFSPDKAG